jgi:beta-glucosidase
VDPAVQRPVRELKAFRKLELDPGCSSTVSFELSARDFAYYDPSDHSWTERIGNRFVPAAAGALHRAEPGWYVDPGRYRVWVGRSSREFGGAIEVVITGESTRLVDRVPS